MRYRNPRIAIGPRPLGVASVVQRTMLYAQRSASGFVGYSSFEDDQFGELNGPNPLPSNPMLALHKLPGGGDYAVFQGNAVTTLKSRELQVGDDSIKMIEADTLSYNAGTGRTQVLFTDDVVTLEEDTEYAVSLTRIPSVTLEGTLSLGVKFTGAIQVLPTPVTLSGTVRGGGLFAGVMTVGAVNDNVELAGTLRLGGAFSGAMTVGAVPAPGPVELAGALRGGGAFNGAMLVEAVPVAPVTLAGALMGAGKFTGAMLVEAVPVPAVTLAGTILGGGKFTGAMTVAAAYTEPSSAQVIAAMPAQDATHTTAIQNLISTLQTQGIWSKLDSLYVFAAQDIATSRVNWLRVGNTPTYNLSDSSDATFEANKGYSNDGSKFAAFAEVNESEYPSPRWDPSDGFVFARMSALAPNGFTHIVSDPYSNGFGIDTTNTGYQGASAGSPTELAIARGASDFILVNHPSDTVGNVVHVNGTKGTENGAAANGSEDPQPMFVAALGNNVAHGTIAASGWGKSLTDAQVASLRTALDTYMTEIVAVVTPETETNALVAQMAVQPSTSRKTNINKFVKALKTAGVWAKLDALFVYAAHTEQAGTVNWVNPANKADQGAKVGMQHTQDVGFKAQAANSYMLNGFVPGLGTKYQPASGIIFARPMASGIATGGTLMGHGFTTQPFTHLGAQSGGNMVGRVNMTSGVVFGVAMADRRALISISKTTSTLTKMFRGAVQQSLIDSGGSASYPPGQMVQFNSGETDSAFQSDIGVMGWGSGLTDTEVAALNTATEEYLAGLAASAQTPSLEFTPGTFITSAAAITQTENPSGTVAGDTLLAVVISKGTNAYGAISGWTALKTFDVGSSTAAVHVAVFTKTATGLTDSITLADNGEQSLLKIKVKNLAALPDATNDAGGAVATATGNAIQLRPIESVMDARDVALLIGLTGASSAVATGLRANTPVWSYTELTKQSSTIGGFVVATGRPVAAGSLASPIVDFASSVINRIGMFIRFKGPSA